MFLNKIPYECLVEFFIERFSETGKKISEAAAGLIAKLVDCHPYYAQQLAQLSWLRTGVVCDEDIVRGAFNSLVAQLSLLFVNITESLTNQQLNYLKVILAGETAVTSTAVMKKYGISSATAASRSKEALIKNDILDAIGGNVNFQDPVYRHWLKHEYFLM